MPSVCGCMDGSHIPIIPPVGDEDAYINRHQFHSLNILCVCGPGPNVIKHFMSVIYKYLY